MSMVQVTANGKQKLNVGWVREIYGKYGTSVKILLTEEELKELYSLLKDNFKGDGRIVELWLTKRRKSRENQPTHDLTLYLPDGHKLALKGSEYLRKKRQAEERKANAERYREKNGGSEPRYNHMDDPFR